MAYDFPSSPTVGQVVNGYTWNGQAWTGTYTGIPEAPADGKIYSRGSNTWSSSGFMTGPLSVAGPAPAAMQSNTVFGGVLGTLTRVGFNAYLDPTGASWKAASTGYIGVIILDQSAGTWNFHNSAASAAAGASAPLGNIAATLTRDGFLRAYGGLNVGSVALPSTASSRHANAYTMSAAVYGMNAYLNPAENAWKAVSAGYSGIVNISTTTGSFEFASAPSVAAGADAMLAMKATIDANGTFAAAGHVQAQTGNFLGRSDAAVLACSASGGALYLRPNGAGSAAGNVIIDTNGTVTSEGTIYGVNFFTKSGVYGGFGLKEGPSGPIGGSIFNFFWGTPGILHAYIDGTYVGQVTLASDYRIKKDVVDLPSTWETVKALRPIKYTHKDFTPPVETANGRAIDDPFCKADDIERWGFIAHELQETMVESAATAAKDAPDAIQSPNPWTIIAALTRTVQELQARVEALEAANGL